MTLITLPKFLFNLFNIYKSCLSFINNFLSFEYLTMKEYKSTSSGKFILLEIKLRILELRSSSFQSIFEGDRFDKNKTEPSWYVTLFKKCITNSDGYFSPGIKSSNINFLPSSILSKLKLDKEDKYSHHYVL